MEKRDKIRTGNPEHEAGINNMFEEEVKNFFEDESGVGVIEIVLILVVLIGLVIIFKEQINKLLETIFKQINSQSKEVYG